MSRQTAAPTRSTVNRTNDAAFTLVEVLVVTVVLSIVSLAIFNTFANGLRIYKRLSVRLPGEQSVLFLERMTADMRNAVRYRDINFTGTDSRVEFAGLVFSPAAATRLVGRVSYDYDRDNRVLLRSESDFFGTVNRREPVVRHRLSKVTGCSFSYYSYDEARKQFGWEDSWDKPGFPRAVRIEAVLEDDPVSPIQRTFALPLSYAHNTSSP